MVDKENDYKRGVEVASTKKDTLGMYTVAEAARELGISRQSLHKAVKAGRIKVIRFGQEGDVVLISREALEKYKKIRKPGRPKNL